MKFTTLKVNRGDSFLLETDSKKILVDTGDDSDECKDFLLAKNLQELDLVIITHYDADHVNGLLNLIKSKIKIDEIWLPDTFGRIHETLKEEKENLLKTIINNCAEKPNGSHRVIISDRTVDKYDIIEVHNGEIIFHERYDNSEKRDIPIQIIERKPRTNTLETIQPNSNMLLTYINKKHIDTIANIVRECIQKQIKIRWLGYTGQPENKKINPGIDILGLNCKENKNIKAYINNLETIYYLSKINRESLVFKYDHQEVKDFPNILFSADSGFEFLPRNHIINLNNQSVVTASHHGSKDKCNVNTYTLVHGSNLIYVRSDSVNKFRPCTEYIHLNHKYCTVCNIQNENYKQEIILEYKNYQWISNKALCSCR